MSKPPPVRPSWLLDEPPGVFLRPDGRWRWLVWIEHGGMRYGLDGYGWHVWGHRRALTKARHELDRYRRKLDREAAVETVR